MPLAHSLVYREAIQSPMPGQPTRCPQCQCGSGTASIWLKLCSSSVRNCSMSVVELVSFLTTERHHGRALLSPAGSFTFHCSLTNQASQSSTVTSFNRSYVYRCFVLTCSGSVFRYYKAVSVLLKSLFLYFV